MSTEANPRHSVGVAMKRKEDPRFIQGKGHYVDDLSFPGMLYLSLVRSTYPHAEIKNIDISEAMKVPDVKAVISGKDLEAAGLGWLPTFHGFDKQMVLAIGKVLFQYQEVAARLRAGVVAGYWHSRGQDPRDLTRPGRRLRQQGPGVPWLRLRDCWSAEARPTGQMD